MGFSRQEYWSGLPFLTLGDLPDPGMKPIVSCISCTGRWILYHYHHWEAHDLFWCLMYCLAAAPAAAAAKSLQSCLTLFDPIDGSPPGFPIPGILQARTLEWVAISFSTSLKKTCGVSVILIMYTFCCCCSVAKLCLILFDPMECSMPGSPVLYSLPEFA